MVALRALDIKVLRDLVRLRGQVIAIGLVVASGVAVLIMSLSTLDALRETTDTYYERYRLAHVFASLKRAPRHLAERISAIEGVTAVQTRIVRYSTLDIEGFAEPVMGQLVSLPDRGGEPLLNRLVIREGRHVEPGNLDEVLLNEPFAQSHELHPGDHLVAILNGHRRTFKVVGIALSPEFIYSLGPGALMPDDKRFGVIWVAHETLEAAFDLQEAFNDVVLELARNVNPAAVIPKLDKLLEPYGGVGAIARSEQTSNWFVRNEMEQLAIMSRVLPIIFLAISVFLTNMVLSRLINTERTQIGLMKAFGYSDFQIGAHYTKIVLGIAAFGILVGVVIGSWFGRWNTQQYAELFHFPLLLYRPSFTAFLISGGLSMLAAVAGALIAVRRASSIPPAEAMLPPAPPVFQRGTLLESRGARWLDQPTRIILRNIGRTPLRSALTGGGVACSVGLLVLALQWNGSINYLAETNFFQSQRQDVTIGLAEAQAATVKHEFEHMSGVLSVEPMRVVRAEFHSGPISHRGALSGIVDTAWLQPVFDDALGAPVQVPDSGLVLSTALAEKLGVTTGDRVWLKVLQDRRPIVELPVVRLVETYIGTPAYINIDALNRLLKVRPSVEYLSLLVDRNYEARLYRELKSLPMVSAVMLRQAAIDSFHETIGEHLMVFITMFSILACALGVGVAYNSTRIALSERSRELATLRVLGFSNAETSYILLGEVALLIILALPAGCLLGRILSGIMAAMFSTELFRVPLVIEPDIYGLACVISLLATASSAALVGRRIRRLDLIEVLKTKE